MLEQKYFNNDFLNTYDLKQWNSTLTDLIDFVLIATSKDGADEDIDLMKIIEIQYNF